MYNKRALGKLFAWLKRHLPTFVVGFVFAILCFLGLNAAMAPVSKSNYCGSECHEMNTAYTSWELSVHGSNKYGYRVECIYCHLPAKESYFSHMAMKAYEGGKDVFRHYFGDKYNVEKMRTHVLAHIPNSRCQQCHNDLLALPRSSAARTAHLSSITEPDKPEYRCVKCHENIGHERKSKLFAP